MRVLFAVAAANTLRGGRDLTGVPEELRILLAEQKISPEDLKGFASASAACDACKGWSENFKDADYVTSNEGHCPKCHAGKSRCKDAAGTYMWACWDYMTLDEPEPCEGEFEEPPMVIENGLVVTPGAAEEAPPK